MAKTVGIIPARYHSKRLPGKPLALIQGKPMIQHVYERASEAASLERLVVATDDARIQEAVVAFGGAALMTSSDHASGTDRVAEAARLLLLPDEAIVVNIQGDEPLLQAEVVDSLVHSLRENQEAPMATLAHSSTDSQELHDPAVVKVVLDGGGRALYFSRAPIPFARNGPSTSPFLKHLGLYAYRHGFLQQVTSLSPGTLENVESLEQLRVLEHGFPILVVVVPCDFSSVDTEEDLARVRRIMAEQRGPE